MAGEGHPGVDERVLGDEADPGQLRRPGSRIRSLTHAGGTACDGPPGPRIAGLPDATVREAGDRI